MYASLTYRDLPRAVAWLGEAFDFQSEPFDAVSAVVRYGDGLVIIQTDRPADLHGTHLGQGWVYVVVPDAHAHHARATAAGAEVLNEPHPMGGEHYGYSARDFEGNLWSFGTAPAG